MSEPLFDVSSMSFDELMADDSPNLAACIQRLVTSLDDPNGIITAFQSMGWSED